jgi:hypothetical protein
VFESIELVGCFTFFWLFLFSRKYRESQTERWREGGWLERSFILLEAFVSFTIGAVVPAALLSPVL